ncbi:hypothetical protein HYDPIDRAFT_105702 [Hydnomerulius pinastri MD-312]|nr:hypothetical protein HYDPIDRAFT_105702 [Hydnomerulius pinastri MD-312]
MLFTFSSSSIRNTIIATETGQAIYSTNTPAKSGSRVTTISKVQPNSEKEDMRDRFESFAEIEWHTFSSSVFRYEGKETKTKDFIPSGGIQGRRRTFVGPDGKSYKWVLNFTSVTLVLNDESKTELAHFRRSGIFGKTEDAVLEVSDSVAHMLDLVILTFIYVEKLRRDKETMTRNAAISAGVGGAIS